MPLIDLPPAHHDTVKTAIARGLSLAKTEGEDVLIFTADQQLYTVTIDVMFNKPFYFHSIIPILGGMQRKTVSLQLLDSVISLWK